MRTGWRWCPCLHGPPARLRAGYRPTSSGRSWPRGSPGAMIHACRRGPTIVRVVVRDDLAEAHRLAWEHIAAPGSWWSGAERVELAGTALLAIADDDPLPPWVGVTSTGTARRRPRRAAAAHDVAYRLARHAGTMTGDVYRAAAGELGELPYVELCAIVSTVAAVAHFCRNIGVAVPPLPAPIGGRPTGSRPERLAQAQFNWVPVAEPADRGGGGRPGLHRGPRRAAQHLAHGRRPVHAGAGDGEPGLVAPAGRAVTRPDGARRGPADEAARLLLLSDRPRQHAQLEQRRDRSAPRPGSRRRRRPGVGLEHGDALLRFAGAAAAPTTSSSPPPGPRSSPRPTRRSWSTPPPSPPTSR